MSQKKKRLTSLMNQKKGRSFKELVSVLRKYGYIVDESEGTGSHSPVYHSVYKDIPDWTISKNKPMKVYHVDKVISLAKEVEERERK